MRKIRFALIAAIAAFTLVAGSFHSAYAQTGTARPFATGMQVQNLGSSEAEITIEFYEAGNGTAAVTFNDTISAEGKVTYGVLDGSNSSEGRPGPSIPAGFNGSAVISSDQQVSAVVNVISPDITLGFGGEAYIGIDSGATQVNLPVIFKDFFDFNTFFHVQNASSTAANVTVTYDNGATETANIPPNAAARFDQQTNDDLPSNYRGSAIVTSDQAIVASVVQVGPSTVLAYNGITEGATDLVFPLVNSNNAGYFTGIGILNTGDSETTVTVSYTPDTDGAACTETITIPAQQARDFAQDAFSASPAAGYDGQNDCAGGELFIGSGQVTANSADQPLVATVNQLNSGDNKAGTYTGFNPSDATDTINFAIVQDRHFDFFTGLGIVNVGDSETTVTCTYNNTTYNESATVAPGGSFTPRNGNAFPEGENQPGGYNGSGVCTASAGGQIVGIGNQLNLGLDTDAFFVYEGTNN